MTARELYKRFISLCQKWPLDEQKVGRDYGQFFRKQLSLKFPHGESSQITDVKTVEEQLSSLENIVNNTYYNENPLRRSSASGAEVRACRDAVSNDGLRTIHEMDEETFIVKLKRSIDFRFSKEEEEYLEKTFSPKEEKKTKDK